VLHSGQVVRKRFLVAVVVAVLAVAVDVVDVQARVVAVH
jgi:cell division protein FtsL